MIPEAAEIDRRVLALSGTSLTEADVHRFLLDVADFLGDPPLQMLGPGIRFRWLVGDQIIQIRPSFNSYDNSYKMIAACLDYEQVINNCEYRNFNVILPPYHFGPYLWSTLLREPPDGWWYPGNPIVRTWAEFDSTIDDILQSLPEDISLIPPAWRDLTDRSEPWSTNFVPAYLWNGGDAVPWGAIALYPDQGGILVHQFYPFGKEKEIYIPRDLMDTRTVSITKILGGCCLCSPLGF